MDLDKFYGSLIDYLIRKDFTPEMLSVVILAVELSRRWATEAEG